MMSFVEKTKLFCSSIGCDFVTDAVMKDYTTFRIGGPADILVMPDSEQKLSDIIGFACSNEIDCTIIGKGSNVLVSDKGIRGIVVLTTKMDSITLLENGEIFCLAGTSLMKLCRFALEHSLSGLEFAYGIPGTAGGAAYMNAGAYGGEMKDVILSCNHIDRTGKPGCFNADELGLGYRKSVYVGSDYIITGVKCSLTDGNKEDIQAEMNDYLSRRKDKQPLEYPSAGSTFKRPEGYFAGALIEQCGLKGRSVGGAQVSEKHAGFVINKGNATAQDVLNLTDYVRETVLKNTGVSLEPEIRFIG